MPNKYQAALDALDPDLANVDKSELGDWAADYYDVIRAALQVAALEVLLGKRDRYVEHIDGNARNNSRENLRVVTRQENNR